MDENLKMFLGLISEKMNAPEVESLETEAKELEAQLEKNRQELEALQQEGGPAEGEADKAPTAQAVVPEQREGIRSFLIPFEPEHHTNGATPPADPTGTARQS